MLRFIVPLVFLVAAVPMSATLVSVVGPLSSLGASPAIIAPPANVLSLNALNFGQQGFNEAQSVVTSTGYLTDQGVLPAGSLVDSHMIFFNAPGPGFAYHYGVLWTFDNPIVGVMSGILGGMEALSTPELGAPGTNYTVPFLGSGLPAPYLGRGLEPDFGDSYVILGNSLLLNSAVTDPGDWVRVITAVPEPSTLGMVCAGVLLFLVLIRRNVAAN